MSKLPTDLPWSEAAAKILEQTDKESAKAVATAIGKAWASFASEGRPSPSPNASWTAYTNRSDRVAVLRTTTRAAIDSGQQAAGVTDENEGTDPHRAFPPAFPLRMQPNPRAAYCDFWERHGIV